MENNKKLFTTKEAAAVLRISEGFVRKLIAAKKMNYIRLGERAVRISATELDRIASGE